jgi:integrase
VERSGAPPEGVGGVRQTPEEISPPGSVVHKAGEIVIHPAPGSNDGKLPESEVENLASLFEGAGSENTRRAYRRIGRDYGLWCQENGFTPCPAHAQTILGYLSSLHRAGKAFSTIDQALAAISTAHRTRGFGFNTMGAPVTDGSGGLRIRQVPAVQRLLSELEKCLPPPQKKTPLVVGVLEQLLAKVRRTPRGRRDRAIILLGFMTACRRSELVKLDLEDVKPVVEAEWSGALITFRGRRKTNQKGDRPHTVAVPRFDSEELLGICACHALGDWLEKAKIEDGPLFRPIVRKQIIARRLTARQVARIVKKYALKAGFDPEPFAGHSLRSGFMTEGHERRVELERLMRQTGHKSRDVAAGYARPTGDGALLKNSPIIDMFLKKKTP